MARDNSYSTKKKASIMQYFENNPDKEVGVHDLYEYLMEQELEMNLTTVYRNLDKLVEQGVVVRSVHGKKDQATYRYLKGREGCSHHLHLKCKNCGYIMHLDCGFMKEIAKHIEGDHGFMIDCKESYITGLCAQCSEQA